MSRFMLNLRQVCYDADFMPSYFDSAESSTVFGDMGGLLFASGTDSSNSQDMEMSLGRIGEFMPNTG